MVTKAHEKAFVQVNDLARQALTAGLINSSGFAVFHLVADYGRFIDGQIVCDSLSQLEIAKLLHIRRCTVIDIYRQLEEIGLWDIQRSHCSASTVRFVTNAKLKRPGSVPGKRIAYQ